MLQLLSPVVLNWCLTSAFIIGHVASHAPRGELTAARTSGNSRKFQTADLVLPDFTWHKSQGQTDRQKVVCPSRVKRSARAVLGRLVKSGHGLRETVPGAANAMLVKRSPQGLMVQLMVQLFFSNSTKWQQLATNWDLTSAHAQGRLPYVDAIVTSYRDSADDLLHSETSPETVPETFPETVPETSPETVPETVGETSGSDVQVLGANGTDLPPDVFTEWKEFQPEVSMSLSKRMLPLGEGIVGTLLSPPSRTCQMNTYRVKVSLAGCVPTSLVATVCSGQCHSRSVPQWTMTSTSTLMLRQCTCCSPQKLRTVPYELSCPGRIRKRLVVSMSQPLHCSCRPCDQTDQ